MRFTTLVDTNILSLYLDNSLWVVMDCRFILTDPGAGLRAYASGHIPGARYVHLAEDLSSPITSFSGRHPLPYPNTLAEKLGQWGVDKNTQVIVYDDASGSMAARLWWLLRWLGHEAAAVLNGGFSKWQREERPVATASSQITPTQFYPIINNAVWVNSDHVGKMLHKPKGLLIDARANKRFRGEVEPVDKIAGHIPGAISMPYEYNLDVSGEFISDIALREHYLGALKGVKPDLVVHMCGSGVTACHNILAMEHAGLSGSKLYAGSWSEWITDGRRPIATGD